MAAGMIAAPGTEYGPCKGECGHIDCLATRNMAAEVCHWCDKAIGYDRRFYDCRHEGNGYVHAGCEEKQYA